ncbi:MAG: exopolyphosphatase [Flavobacteriales bacterium]|nr:exopolyphosphatase [Flavobacteriales bacterium]
MRLAAADIGSNAVRFIFYNVYEGPSGPVFKKISVVRLPVRLGDEVFEAGKISPEKVQTLVKALRIFALMTEVHQCDHFRIVATSAMREAANSLQVVQEVYYQTGLEIQIIDGQSEAGLIFANLSDLNLPEKFQYLYVDVGGGSTELTLYANGHVVFSGSYNIGTLRMLKGQNLKSEWKRMFRQLNLFRGKRSIRIIGTGGNINKLHRLAGLKEGQILKRKKLEEVYQQLCRLSYEDRLIKLGLNQDRADVIVPAAEVFLKIADRLNVSSIVVPKLGLSDGLIHTLFEEVKNQQKRPVSIPASSGRN